MQVKRYEAANLQEATAKIKSDLGPDAIILSTKKIASRPPRIEVMAARDEEAPGGPSTDPLPARPEASRDDLLSDIAREVHELKAHFEGWKQALAGQADLAELRETMGLLVDHLAAGTPAHLRALYRQMVDNGISRLRAARLVEAIRKHCPHPEQDDHGRCATLAERLIAGSLPRDDRKERRVKAFIGPTGVGKTTTLAKLAAHYSLEKRLKVGLITTDTYRIAAVEQLKVYAKIMGLPLEIAADRPAFVESLMHYADRDVVLVDTPGRNPGDGHCLEGLKAVLQPEAEAILLLSPATRRDVLLESAHRFRTFDYDRLILTKVDECSRLGALYEVLDEIGRPVSHVTTGQNVPRDIEPASPEKLARWMLAGGTNACH